MEKVILSGARGEIRQDLLVYVQFEAVVKVFSTKSSFKMLRSSPVHD